MWAYILMLTMITSSVTVTSFGAMNPLPQPVTDKIATIATETLPDFESDSYVYPWEAIFLVKSGNADKVKAKTIFTSAGALDLSITNTSNVTKIEKYAIALTALGVDATNVSAGALGSINLIAPICSRTISNIQDANEAAFALTALDSGNYDDTGFALTRGGIIDYLVSAQAVQVTGAAWQIADFFNPGQYIPDVDVTAMVVAALAPYYGLNQSVKNAVDEAILYLSDKQEQSGGYATWGSSSPNTMAVVLVALASLGIDPLTATDFVKDGNLVDALVEHATTGGFSVTWAPGADPSASEQGFRAFMAYKGMVQSGGAYNIYQNIVSGQTTMEGNGTDGSALTDPAPVNGGGNNGGSSSPNTITISLKVKNASGNTIASNTNMSVQAGSTVLAGLVQLLSSGNIHYTLDGSYVAEINGLSEFDQGKNSGWKYKVNGMAPGVSARSYVLSGGEQVEWYYISDYTQDTKNDETSMAGPVQNATQSALLTSLPAIDTKELQQIGQAIVDGYKANNENSDWAGMIVGLWEETGIPQKTIDALNAEVKQNGGNFRLPTDAARIALTLQNAGKDLSNIGGVDLLKSIYNNENMGKQGLNGYIFSLMALSNADYIPAMAKMDVNTIKKTIMDAQNNDGGFPLSEGSDSNLDITAMTIQGLAPYRNDPAVKLKIDKAIDWISSKQNADGRFSFETGTSSETISQVIIALCAVGVNPDDKRFTKNGKTLMEMLLTYKTKDGKFSHAGIDGENDMATEQAMLALISYQRYFEGKAPIFAKGIEPKPYLNPYNDEANVSGWAKKYVEKAKELGMASGDSKGNVNPKQNVTRAEFVIMLLKNLGQSATVGTSSTFDDVTSEDWYASWIDKAVELDLVHGTGDGKFSPNAPISRQDMAVIMTNAFKIKADRQDIKDLDSANTGAIDSIHAVVGTGIMSGVGADNFDPKGKVSREMALTVNINAFENVVRKK